MDCGGSMPIDSGVKYGLWRFDADADVEYGLWRFNAAVEV